MLHMTSERFYSELTALDDFSDLLDPAHYAELPDDWSVVIADVRGSTKAIREGRYKEVNVVGVSVITSIVNAAKPVEIPYLFGGDGASLCVPESGLPRVRQALVATKRMALEAYGLELRTGVVPMPVLRRAGHRVLVARQRLSPKRAVAAFAGEGILVAEERVKNPQTQALHEIKEEGPGAQADYTGLECRWRPIPSPSGETVSLIVKAVAGSTQEKADLYRELLVVIERVYGDGEARRPVSLKGLKLAVGGKGLWPEVKLKTAGKSKIEQLLCWLRTWALTCLGAVLMEFRVKAGDISWGRYRQDLMTNTDVRKFSGILQQILSGTPAQRQELSLFLEEGCKSRRLVYGMHVSPSALMTCLVADYNGAHIHFLDGSDGGYAMAAVQMKEQLKQRAALRPDADERPGIGR